MTIDSLEMISRGWQEVAATVAPQVSGLSDLLERSLREAQALASVDEASLLSIIDAATQLAANSGAVEFVPALSKRLRRQMYEYLLSLDAAGDDRIEPADPGITAPSDGGPLIGADEVAALGRDRRPHTGDGSGTANLSLGAEPVEADVQAATRRDGGWAAPSPPEPAPDGGVPDASSGSGFPPPRFSFHIGDPNDMLAAPALPREHESDTGPGALPELFPPVELHPPVDVPTPRRTAFADPSTWPTPVTQRPRSRPHRGSSTRTAAGVNGSGHPMAPPAPNPARGEPARRGEDRPAARAAPPETRAAVTASPDARPAAGPADPGRGTDAAHPPSQGAPREAVGPDLGSALEPSAAPGPGPDAPLSVNPASERDLAELRAAVEERLRKKRWDESARLLQRAAQDLGGPAVAAIALQAGDRCRNLGKRGAALNCYLAASRADPIFEQPLARLADICIEDRDIDLAVSYLERIARLTRLRGDKREALGIYRRIATLAPYRDDVLETLMRAEKSGRID